MPQPLPAPLTPRLPTHAAHPTPSHPTPTPCRLVYGYGLVVLLMVLIRLASADYLWAGFPNECPSDKRFGCSRIAESNPHGARHLTPLHLTAAMPDVQAQAEAWVAASAQARLLKDSRPGFLHARYLTWFWGFADDFMVSLRWVGAGMGGALVGWVGGWVG